MAYLKKNYEALYEAMANDLRQRVPELTDFEPGSVVRSLLETLAFEQKVFYEQLDYVYDSAFVNTAQSLNLEKVVAILDVYRNEPDYATGTVTFTKTDGYEEEIIIPVGTLIVTEDDPNQKPARKAYLTITEGRMTTADQSVTVKVQAEQRGREMATDANTLIVLPKPIAGVEQVTNAKAIAFVGRDRETDEELRERAKKALLSAGRASHTSIEQALLSLPKILDVKILEPRETPGVIDVYVDGLTQDNSKALRARLDEVRAAGVYARLKAADRVEVHATIKLIPHPSVITDEMAVLEASVQDALEKYIRSLGMGDAMSSTRLTTEMLNVKGVQDVEHYEILLIPSPPRPIPGTLPEAAEDGESPLPSQATGATSEKPEIGFLIGQGESEAPIYQVPPDTKKLLFSQVARFIPTRLRVAAGIKPLPIQIHVKVRYLNAQSTENVHTKVAAEYAKLSFSTEDLTTDDLPVTTEVIAAYVDTMNEYLGKQIEAILDGINTLRVNPLADRGAEFNNYLREASGLVNQGESTLPEGDYALDEATIKQHFHDIAKAGGNMKNPARDALLAIIEQQAAQARESFPHSALATKLLAESTSDLRTQLDALKQDITALNQTIANKQLKLVSDSTLTAAEKPTLRNEIEATQASLLNKQAQQDVLQNKLSNVTYALNKLLDAWSEAVADKLLSQAADGPMSAFVNSISKLTDFDLSLRLRALNFEGKEYYHQPVPVSFIETPSLDFIWVYSMDLRLAGTLKLALSANASDQEQDALRNQVREAVAAVLYNKRPEEDIPVQELLDTATNINGVLGAKFTTPPSLVEDQMTTYKPLPDRLTKEHLVVKASERVLLSDKFFSITS